MGPDISLPMVTILSRRTSQMSIWERQMTQNRIYQNAKARVVLEAARHTFPLQYLDEHSRYARRSAAHLVKVDVAAMQLSATLCLALAEAG